MDRIVTEYFVDRKEWRAWLLENFDREEELWLIYPKKASGKPRILYNDAVEEALCFGWIDSKVKALDENHTIQRFSVRRAKSNYSQANKERLKWLSKENLLHPSVVASVDLILKDAFVFPKDILAQLKKDKIVWEHYNKQSAPYQRIRIAYIESARKRPEEFEKRIANFMNKTRAGKLIRGFGGIDKYY